MRNRQCYSTVEVCIEPSGTQIHYGNLLNARNGMSPYVRNTDSYDGEISDWFMARHSLTAGIKRGDEERGGRSHPEV